MKNIDWKVLGMALWSTFKIISIFLVGFGLFVSAIIYLPGWALVCILFLILISWWIMVEYKKEMYKRGNKR